MTLQEADPSSMLAFYRQMIGLRRAEPDLTQAGFAWLDGLPPTCLGFRRGDLICLCNLGREDCPLPAGEIRLASGPCPRDLPPDTTVWIKAAPTEAVREGVRSA